MSLLFLTTILAPLFILAGALIEMKGGCPNGMDETGACVE